MKGVRPVGKWHRTMIKESSHSVAKGSNDTFRFPIFYGGVRTRETELDTVGGKKIMELLVVKFTAIVTLKRLDRDVELCFG